LAAGWEQDVTDMARDGADGVVGGDGRHFFGPR
jgi:hypothetical protein